MGSVIELEFPLLVVMGSKITPIISSKDLRSLMRLKLKREKVIISHANTPDIKLNLITDINGNVYTFKEEAKISNWFRSNKIYDFSFSVNTFEKQNSLTVSEFRELLKKIKDTNKVKYGSSFKVSVKMTKFLNAHSDNEVLSKTLCVKFFEKYYPRYLNAREKFTFK